MSVLVHLTPIRIMLISAEISIKQLRDYCSYYTMIDMLIDISSYSEQRVVLLSQLTRRGALRYLLVYISRQVGTYITHGRSNFFCTHDLLVLVAVALVQLGRLFAFLSSVSLVFRSFILVSKYTCTSRYLLPSIPSTYTYYVYLLILVPGTHTDYSTCVTVIPTLDVRAHNLQQVHNYDYGPTTYLLVQQNACSTV